MPAPNAAHPAAVAAASTQIAHSIESALLTVQARSHSYKLRGQPEVSDMAMVSHSSTHRRMKNVVVTMSKVLVAALASSCAIAEADHPSRLQYRTKMLYRPATGCSPRTKDHHSIDNGTEEREVCTAHAAIPSQKSLPDVRLGLPSMELSTKKLPSKSATNVRCDVLAMSELSLITVRR